MEIKFFDSSLEKFIYSLEKKTIARVLHVIDLLEEFEYTLGFPHTKKVCGDVFELRVRGRQEIRIFYIFHKSDIILLHGFLKKSPKIPQKEIENALKKCQEYKRK